MEVGLTIKDQYQVVEHIGRGGMADVWSARDQRLNRLVAIKTISQSLSTEADPIALFEQEAQTIAQMEHPHILPIYDFGDYRSNLYIVMRYVTGGSLEDRLEEKPLTLQDTLQIVGNIAKALDYAHENNVIHLDLKPPNILMDSGGSPYLADFGLATVLDKQGRAQNPGSGTLLYMAPEQLTAEVIDHRADIYSFCVMIFHMLTGTLPFDGMVPLAIKQLQFQERMPDLSHYDEEIPYQITDILRQGTETEPSQRQNTLAEIVNQMEEALQLTSIDLDSSWGEVDPFGSAFGMDSALTVNIDDAGLLEAADIYVRAKHVWAGGNGRFLLGVSHFMMMSDYYIEAETHDLELDEMGLQMLLRGALEYDYQIKYWWDQVDDTNRRWVCLHTIRSENAPARIRALYRLETLPDDEIKPVIPNLVANALSIETNHEAKIAALTVLGTRSKLIKTTQSFNIKTEYRGRLLSTGTRLGIEILPEQVWRDAVYAPEIDLLIAKEALDEDDDEVSETAARIVGRMRSLTSLRFIADAQRQNEPNALRSLALIRDEAPYLPDVVSRQARLYAWIANTIRRLTDNPMELVFRFIFALLGGAIAFGQHVYITYRSQALFVPQRWGNTLAVGLMMGLFIAILVMFSDVLISRLKGFWPNWLRLILSATFGILFGTLVWTGFTWLYLNQQPLWDLMRMGGLGLAFGLIASTMFSLKSWQSLILTSTSIFLTIFIAYYNSCTQLFYCFSDANFNIVEGVTNFSMSPIVLAGFLFGIMFGTFISRSELADNMSPAPPYGLTKYGGLGLLLVLGFGGAVITSNIIIEQALITWDHVLLLFAIPMVLSAIAMLILDRVPRLLYVGLGLIGYGAIMLQIQSTITGVDTLIAPQFGADYIDPLFAYDLYWQAFTVALPVSITIAFGAFAMEIFRDLRHIIGIPQETPERNAWLTGILLYVMVITGFITVLAPFSSHQDVLWGIGWSALGGITFTSALATWQWKQWGARALLVCGILFIIGTFLADIRATLITSYEGNYPQIFSTQSLVFWGTWSVITGTMTIGTMRQKLWSAFGLVVMIVLWFIISIFINDIGDSLTALAIVHVPLIAYALRFDWHLFQDRKEKAKHHTVEPTPVTDNDTPPASQQVVEMETVHDLAGTLTDETELDLAGTLSDETELDLAGTLTDETELDLAGTLSDETELDLAGTLTDVNEFETVLDLSGTLSDANNLDTELDLSGTLSDETELDLSGTLTDASDLDLSGTLTDETELDLSGTLSDETDLDLSGTLSDETELDLSGTLTDASDLDLSGTLTDETELDLSGTLTDADDLDTAFNDDKIEETPSDDKPKSASTRKGLKIDTGLLSSKPKDKSTTTRKGLKIDTGLLGSKPDSKQPRKGLKIDTGLLGGKSGKSETKPDNKSTRKGLQIDAGLLGGKSSKSETKPKREVSPKDETLPSRETTQLSTSEIKKQIAEEAIQMKEEADRKKSESKPKFKLNTGKLKPDNLPKTDDTDDKSSDDKE